MARHNLKSNAKRLRKAQETLQAQVDAPCFSIRPPPSDPALARFRAPAKAPHVCGARCVVVAVQRASQEADEC